MRITGDRQARGSIGAPWKYKHIGLETITVAMFEYLEGRKTESMHRGTVHLGVGRAIK